MLRRLMAAILPTRDLTVHESGRMPSVLGLRATRFLRPHICLLLALACGSLCAQENGTVTLAWDANSDSRTASYTLYYGTATRSYSSRVFVGNVTAASISGLVAGVTYYFSVTAFSAIGLESDFSDEIAYTIPPTAPPPLPQAQLRVRAGPGGSLLNVTGQPGGSYEILATSLTPSDWSVIGTLTLDDNGSGQFNDTGSGPFLIRFYRVREKTP